MKRLLILGVITLVGCYSNPYIQENSYTVSNDPMNAAKKQHACLGKGGVYYDVTSAGTITCGNGEIVHYDDWSKEVLY